MDKHFSSMSQHNVPDVIRSENFSAREENIPVEINNDPKIDSFSHSPSPILEIEEPLETKNATINRSLDSHDGELTTNQQQSTKEKSTKPKENTLTTMEAESNLKLRSKQVPSLKRTLSEHATFNMNQKETSIFGSHEALTNTAVSKVKKQSFLPPQRRKSLERSESSRGNLLKKHSLTDSKRSEKGIVTEAKDLTQVKPKVNSIREPRSRPRSQIVAAVTQRLYAKSKLKEVSTNTENMKAEKDVPKELNICSNARLRLKELTQKALKAHKNRDGMTQTDLFPVIRVKETSTDVNDLRLETKEIKSVSTMIDEPVKQDVSTNCTYLDCFNGTQLADFRNAFIMTRSCGTQIENMNDDQENVPKFDFNKPTAAFSKCMHYRHLQRLENLTSNPIYANSVNINISHNYIKGHQIDDATSHDSLEDEPGRNAHFQTPDLISNHNSLEQHGKSQLMTTENILQEPTAVNTIIKFAETSVALEPFSIVEDLSLEKPVATNAFSIIIPDYCKNVSSTTISSFFVTETCLVTSQEDRCLPFPLFSPETAVPNVTELKDFELDDCITFQEPQLLKSIMKHAHSEAKVAMPEIRHSDNTSEDHYLHGVHALDSLEYHARNTKKVRFDRKNSPERDKFIETMSNFFEEASTFMSNLKNAAAKLETSHQNFPSEFDLKVRVNEISGLSCHHYCKKHKKKQFPSHSQKQQTEATQTEIPISEDIFCQTVPTDAVDSSTQCHLAVPINKYEAMLESSCQRLKEKLSIESKAGESPFSDFSLPSNDSNIEEFYQENLPYYPCDLNLAQCSHYENFSSLGSNAVTFSDYGSLPRRYSRRNRISSCSPSAFLRQLTNMRKQVIDSSREKLSEDMNVK